MVGQAQEHTVINMINEKKFLQEIGFALSMVDSDNQEHKLCGLDLIIKEAEAQKQILKESNTIKESN